MREEKKRLLRHGFYKSLIGKNVFFRFREGRYPFAKGDPKAIYQGILRQYDPVINGNFVSASKGDWSGCLEPAG